MFHKGGGMMKKIVLFAASFIAFVVIYPFVVSGDISFTKYTIVDRYNYTMSVYTSDVDGDGDIDILGAAWGSDMINWWENDGSQNFTENLIADDFDRARTVYARDMDGDGDVDILGAGGDKVAWWENDGDENFALILVDIAFDGSHTISARDIDGDEDIDIVCSAHGYSGSMAWWENDGTQIFTKHTISSVVNGHPCGFTEDVDGDTDIDIYGCIFGSGDVIWWENDGNANFTEHFISTTFNGVHWVYATDADSDGDIDLLGASYSLNQIAWWENDGNQNFTQHTISSTFNGATSVYATDLDNDGDTDVLGAAEVSSQIRWWENDGNQNFTEHILIGNWSGASHVYADDVDGDGDMDVLGAANGANEIAWWENDLYGAYFEFDINSGHAPLSVQFTDFSRADPSLSSWTWDFNDDGTDDSQAQHPSWVYPEPGTYSVALCVSNGDVTYCMTQEDCIRVFDGESALQFDGEQGYVSCTATPDLNLSTTFSIEAWIKPSGWGSIPNIGFGRIADKGKLTLYLIEAGAGMNQHSLVVQIHHENGSISMVNTPAQSIELDNWQHVTVTYDGTTNDFHIYIDGIDQTLSQTIQPSGPLADNTAHDLIIGNDASGGIAFDGLIDEVRLWDVVRTEESISTHMNCYLQGIEPGLLVNWQMNEGFGETVTDHSLTGHEGTVVDAYWIQGIHLEAPTVDIDKDGIIDAEDNCPQDYNPEQKDEDSDGIGTVCDNCPDNANQDQADGDSDGLGDVCDPCTDTDDDGFGDPGFPSNTCDEDNCPGVPNPGQEQVETGDINCEGGINVLDVLATVNHILGTAPLLGGPLDRADCKGDGNVNILDALGIINVILGIGECSSPASRPVINDEVIRFCQALKPYLPAADFHRFISMVKEVEQTPIEYALFQNYPNPFNPTTEIRYQIPDSRFSIHTTLKIYNILGQEVATLVDEVKGPGVYTVEWEAADMTSGIYFYRLTCGDFTTTKRMVLMK